MGLIALCLGQAKGQVELSYCTDIEHGYGSTGALYTPYVQFPAQTVAPYEGATVTRVLIGLNSSVTNVTLYIKNAPRDNRPLYSQSVGQLEAGWNEVVLTTPYVIGHGEDLAIGYRARLTQDGGIGYSTVKNTLAEQVLINQSSQWATLPGAVCMRVILEGEALPEREMVLDRLSDQRIDAGADSLTFTGVVHNMGTARVTQYQLNCQVDGEEVGTFDVPCDLPTNAADTFSIALPQTYALGNHSVTLRVSSVNGESDQYEANNTSTFSITIPDPRFARRAVCEEYTGLWCGWCPKGLVGLELMKEQHPDRFIAVSIHGGQGDGLEIPKDSSYTYYDFWQQFPGAPDCKMNRRLGGDPYLDIERLYRMETTAENHVALTSEAQWNADSTQITITSELMTDVNLNESPYRVAYIVLEDGITGYVQTNYFGGGANGEFYGWENKGQYTMDVVFNDVARGIFGGIEGTPCIEGSIIAMQPYTLTGQIAVPAEVADKAQVHVVTIVMDGRSGFIQNGCNSWPVADPAGIEAVRPDCIQPMNEPMRRLDGMILPEGQRRGFGVVKGRVVYL